MSKGLRISFFGSSLTSAYWNGAATYYRGIIRELHKCGHTITFYEPDVYERQNHRDIINLNYAESIIYKPEMDDLNQCIEKARDSDIIIKTSGIGIFDEYLEASVLDLKSPGNKIIFWDVDAPATLDRIKKNEQDPFIKLIPEYDLIFTYGGGNPVVNQYMRFGARKCFPVYNALDPSTHFPEYSNERFEGTLGFMGNRLPDREKRVHEFFFEAAALLPNKKFILGGNGWDAYVPSLNNVKWVGHVYTHEHNAFYCSTLATLNINRQSMADYGFSPPTRIFEAAGAGACIICDQWKGIEVFLNPGTECIIVDSGKNLAEVLKNLTALEAKKIGHAGYERVYSEHTYEKRAFCVEKELYSCENSMVR